MGTKMAVAFANIFMAKIEKSIISKSIIKPLVWKRYIDDVFCLWDTNEDNREFKKLRRQLQRKRHIKIELCVKLSFLRLSRVDHVV